MCLFFFMQLLLYSNKKEENSRYFHSNIYLSVTMQISVFEHQVIRIGMEWSGQIFMARHYRALVRYQSHLNHHWYRILPDGIRFSHYVGVLQVGDLTIEILPKTETAAPEVWRRVLLEMLQMAGVLKVETAGPTGLGIRPNFLLDYYYDHFLEKVNRLLNGGLVRKYRSLQQNEKAWKGQLDFQKQIQHNTIHQERFFVRRNHYDYSHPANQIISQALRILPRLTDNLALKNKAIGLQTAFPVLPTWPFSENGFREILDDKAFQRYRPALELAYLIIKNFQPDIRTGRHHVLAILFDMNQLFEVFIYEQLKRINHPAIEVHRQLQRPFWLNRKIRPDIFVKTKKDHLILDTKWKILSDGKPSMDDLKQIFIYNQYFAANKGVLIYPGIGKANILEPIPYHPLPNGSEPGYCEIKFVEVLKNNKLNLNIGKEILNI